MMPDSNMNKITFRRQQGFSLVELLVTTVIMGILGTVTMGFLSDFSSVGNRNALKYEMEGKLRDATLRIEKEVLAAARVSESDPTDNTIKSNKTQIFLDIPVYNATGFVVIDNTGKPMTDTIRLRSEVDNDAEPILLRNANGLVKPSKLTFKLVQKQANSDRRIRTMDPPQVLTKDIRPVDGAKRYTRDNPKTALGAGNNIYDYGVIQYLNVDLTGTITDKTTTVVGGAQSAFDEINLIRIHLFAEKQYGSDLIQVKKMLEVKLRNFSN